MCGPLVLAYAMCAYLGLAYVILMVDDPYFLPLRVIRNITGVQKISSMSDAKINNLYVRGLAPTNAHARLHKP